ncbi:MAG: 5-formyltetrahydrofolate cyclo-ligase [Eubacteriales bacterium]|nr:5-formyltetrahydrofolate cyclo-ligase [Eubacteriales bacterium]MDY3333035.1 5-formyltetrahydrofolate cyclo-ligase [Gallibacter sp.]
MKSEKENLRKQVLDIRKGLNKSEVSEKSSLICSKLVNYINSNNIKTICSYMPINNEVDVTPLLQVENVTLFLPKIKNNTMEFYEYQKKESLALSKFGILEPINEESMFNTNYNNDKTLIIVPGNVWSVDGYRIGYGGGYYDRFLPLYSKCHTVGVAYDFQVYNHIPKQDHDQKISTIITETKALYNSLNL